MTPLPPTDPPAAPPAAPQADIHTTAGVAVLTMVALWVLQSTVFRDIVPPSELGYMVSTVVSYGVAQASGRIVRARSRLHRHRAPSGPPAPPTQ